MVELLKALHMLATTVAVSVVFSIVTAIFVFKIAEVEDD